MNKLLRYLFLSISIFIGSLHWAGLNAGQVGRSNEADWNGYALISAQPASARQSGRARTARGNGQVVVGESFLVRLRDVEVLHGDFALQRATVELMASHPKAITNNNRIFILLEISADGSYVPLHWSAPISIICTPRALVETKPFANDFFVYERFENMKCTNAEWFR